MATQTLEQISKENNMITIKKEDVTYVMKISEFVEDSAGMVSSVKFVYRGDYNAHNWGFKLEQSFDTRPEVNESIKGVDATDANLIALIEADLADAPDVDIELFRANPDQDLSNVRLPSPLESLQMQIADEITGLMERA
jgi:hypothetical protein